MKKTMLFLIVVILVFAGCVQQEIKENQVYVVSNKNYPEEQLNGELNTEGRIPFQEYVNPSPVQDNPGLVLLTISPDGEGMYLMERIEANNPLQVIKGEPGETVRIIRENIASKDQEIVIENIPFVSKVLWNTEGNLAAFGGGGRLTIYDVKKRSVLMKEKFEEDIIIDFFWSPLDGNKLYSEHPDLANGSIYYLDSQKKIEAYEIREETYYKGKLDSSYYYGTKWDLASGDIKTVILDKQGKIIKVLTPGKFRGAYQKSLVVVGERGFGLHYIRDINSSEKVITLTEEYVYDVKFVADGKIAYTTKAEDIEANLFYLHLVSNNGSELKKLIVYGSSIAVLPDGNSGCISGAEWQQVDFVQDKLLEKESLVEDYEAGELQDICSTIRGAMMTIYDFELKGKQDLKALKKYFINSNTPEQWARFDVEKIFQERAGRPVKEGYFMEIDLKSFDINFAGDGASVTIGVNAKNPYGRGVVMDYALELIKSEGSWYVTGFSTFPYSKEREEIEGIVQETVDKIQMGKLFSGKLENSEIIVGQIQFWLIGIPNFAPSAESANCVKVFLQVNNQGREEIYKLVLEKINQSLWKPVKLSPEGLSSL